jgi:hypothetical protein
MANLQAFTSRIICVFILFIEIQTLYCFRGKMCRKLEEKVRSPVWAHYPVRETKLYRPCLLDMRTAKALISHKARLLTNRSGSNILAQLPEEKQWVGSGGWGEWV